MSAPAVTAGAPARAAARLRRGRGLALGAAIAVATLLVFAPVVRNEFLNYDDDVNVFRNARLQQGFTLESLRWAFTNVEHQNWHPLTWLSHLLDFRLFGAWAGGHHAVSALLHAANAVLLFAILRAMTGALWRSALVAALFGLHPLRVESVAWAAERKDVLTILFGLLALGAYLRFARRRSAAAYAASLALFGCALMSKAMLVTLPALLLLLDLWPLNRWARGRGGLLLPGRGILLEKLPYLVLAAAASVLAFVAQASGGAVGYVVQFPLRQRVGNAFVSAAAYLGKTFWPANLAVFYPYRWDSVPWWQPLLGAAFVAAASAGVIVLLRRRPVYAVGWAWYLGTILPVIGIIQVGSQSMADRYTYFPQIGVFLMVAWGLGDVAARQPRTRGVIFAAVPLLLTALFAATWVQVQHWRSSETLFRHALRVTQGNYIALANLGSALADRGEVAEGNRLIREAFQINPTFRAAVADRSGDYYAKRGMAREAGEQYRKALAIQPFDRTIRRKLEALGAAANAPAPPRPPHGGVGGAGAPPLDDLRRGLLLANAGHREAAVAAFREALRKQPENAEAWNNMGCALGELGRVEEAAAAFATALRIKPDYAAARSNLEALRAGRVAPGR